MLADTVCLKMESDPLVDWSIMAGLPVSAGDRSAGFWYSSLLLFILPNKKKNKKMG